MATYYWVGGNGTWDASSTTNWAITSGGLPGVSAPNSTDTVIFDSASGTGTCTTASGSACAIATLNSSTLAVTLGANHTMTGAFTLTLGTLSLGSNTLSCNNFSTNNSNVRTVNFGTGNVTLTGSGSNIWGGPASGQTVPLAVAGTPVVNCTYSGAVGTRTLSTGLTTLTGETNSISFNITAGTDIVATAGNHCVRNLNFTGFSGTFNNNARSVFGNLTISSGMTVVAGAQTTTFGATSGTKTITTNAKTIDFPLTFNGIGGTFAFQDALTQGSTRAFTITNGTVQLKSGVTSTVGSFVASNTSVKYLQSTTPGSQATISQASGTITVADLTIQDSNATGGASWTAYADYENIDAGNNDGWNFSISPPYASYEPPIIIRSFTQPRRF